MTSYYLLKRKKFFAGVIAKSYIHHEANSILRVEQGRVSFLDERIRLPYKFFPTLRGDSLIGMRTKSWKFCEKSSEELSLAEATTFD